MKITNLLLIAAAAGFVTGAVAQLSAEETAPATPAATEVEKHACKGQNSCKGKGGCEAADKIGKNECKGQGGCAMPKEEKKAEAPKEEEKK